MKSQNCKKHKNFNHEREREKERCKKQIRKYNNSSKLNQRKDLQPRRILQPLINSDIFDSFSLNNNASQHVNFGCFLSSWCSSCDILCRHILVDYWESINKLNLLLCCAKSIERLSYLQLVYGDIEIGKSHENFIGECVCVWERESFIIFLKWKKCKSPNVDKTWNKFVPFVFTICSVVEC
jgi:hypothetical protein